MHPAHAEELNWLICGGFFVFSCRLGFLRLALIKLGVGINIRFSPYYPLLVSSFEGIVKAIHNPLPQQSLILPPSLFHASKAILKWEGESKA